MRWSDADILSLIKRAIRRAEHVLRANEISVGRAYYTVTTSIGEDEYSLPTDFMAPLGMFRDGTHQKLELCNDETWETIVSSTEVSSWVIRSGKIYIGAAPAGVETLTLVYWPKLDLSGYGLDTHMPWDGMFDEAILEYVALRCRSADDANAMSNEQMLAQLESLILETYGEYNPKTSIMRGTSPH